MTRLIALLLTLLLAGCTLRDSTAQPTIDTRGLDSIVLGMGCFWGAEMRMAALPGVVDVESGYAGGDSANASYKGVLALERQLRRGTGTGRNHAEVVKVYFDPHHTTLEAVLAGFWENHDPTQGDRQGNDVGSNYRSAIYITSPEQRQTALLTQTVYQQALTRAGHGDITTEIAELRNYTPAEAYHQDYLVKNPDGYCGLGGTGVAYHAADDGAVAGLEAPSDPHAAPALDPATLSAERQLLVFEAEDCPYCARFQQEVLQHWRSQAPIAATLSPHPPDGWTLDKPLFATPTIVLFEQGREVSRYTGYNGDQERFWTWLGHHLLTP